MTFDYEKKKTDPPVLPQKVQTPPLAVSDMIPSIPEPDYNALKKFKRGSMSMATVAAIQKTYVKDQQKPQPTPEIKPPSSGLKAGWKGGA